MQDLSTLHSFPGADGYFPCKQLERMLKHTKDKNKTTDLYMASRKCKWQKESALEDY